MVAVLFLSGIGRCESTLLLHLTVYNYYCFSCNLLSTSADLGDRAELGVFKICFQTITGQIVAIWFPNFTYIIQDDPP